MLNPGMDARNSLSVCPLGLGGWCTNEDAAANEDA